MKRYPSKIAENRTGRFFCSPTCRSTWRKDPTAHPESKRFLKQCAGCEKSFMTWPSVDQKYCSRSCRAAAGGYRTVNEVRICAHCAVPFDADHPMQKWCTECAPDKVARGVLLRYGLSAPELAKMYAEQEGRCAICRTSIPAHRDGSRLATIDHDHETGEVRGLLCRRCNMALHYVENTNWWAAAVAYLGR